MKEAFLRTLLPLPPQIKLWIVAKKIYIFLTSGFFHVEIENDCLSPLNDFYFYGEEILSFESSGSLGAFSEF